MSAKVIGRPNGPNGRTVDIDEIDDASRHLLYFCRLLLNLKECREGLDDHADVFQLLADYAFRIHKDIDKATGQPE